VWILDDISPLQELDTTAMASDLHLFSMEPAEQIRRERKISHTGDAVFFGENPVNGAILQYWTARDSGTVSISIHDRRGQQVAALDGPTGMGVHRVIWDLRHSEPESDGPAEQEGRRGGGPRGPLVVPGMYTVRVSALGTTVEGGLEVREDPRIAERVSPETRAAWTETLLGLGELRREAAELARRVEDEAEAVRAREAAAREEADEGEDETMADGAAEPTPLEILARETAELARRIRSLEGEVSDVVAPLTADQGAQLAFYRRTLRALEADSGRLLGG
jgi:hypothetical protein